MSKSDSANKFLCDGAEKVTSSHEGLAGVLDTAGMNGGPLGWRSLEMFHHENLQFIPNKDEMRKTNRAAAKKKKKQLSISPAITTAPQSPKKPTQTIVLLQNI